MSTADTLCMSGIPAPVAKIIGAKPADQYGVAILPNGAMSISAASAALWGA